MELDTFWLQVSTMAAKTQFYQMAIRNAILNEDEVREQIGYGPLPDGFGRIYRISLDTVNIENADAYQVAKNGASDTAGESEKPTGGGTASPEGTMKDLEVNFSKAVRGIAYVVIVSYNPRLFRIRSDTRGQ